MPIRCKVYKMMNTWTIKQEMIAVAFLFLIPTDFINALSNDCDESA